MHLICSLKFCITFVFHSSSVLQPSQEKLKTMLMQNFGRTNKVHYCRCTSGVCIKIKVYFGCPVVACPGATASEILLTTYVRTVRQPQPFDSRLRANRFSSTKFKLSSKATYTRKRVFLKPHTFLTKQPFVHTKPVNRIATKTALLSGLRPRLHES